jgi:hypothetical protein
MAWRVRPSLLSASQILALAPSIGVPTTSWFLRPEKI